MVMLILKQVNTSMKHSNILNLNKKGYQNAKRQVCRYQKINTILTDGIGYGKSTIVEFSMKNPSISPLLQGHHQHCLDMKQSTIQYI